MKLITLTKEEIAQEYSTRYRSRNLNYSDVASILRRKIVSGEFNSTMMLPSQRTLADSYNVARKTVRNALRQIENEGLVETKDRSGTFVTGQSIGEPEIAFSKFPRLDLVETRSCLEPHICKLVTINARKEDFDALDRVCDRIEARPDNWIAFLRADIDFHSALARATRNGFICHLIGRIGSLRLDDLMSDLSSYPQHDAAIAHLSTQHRKIVRALRSRESAIAAIEMRQHVNEEHIYSAMFRANTNKR